MTVVESKVLSVVERFPGPRERILRLFRERESFRTICEDYEKCLVSLRHWSRSHAKEAAARREEYAALLEDLEAEIGEYLAESGRKGGVRDER